MTVRDGTNAIDESVEARLIDFVDITPGTEDVGALDSPGGDFV